MTLSTRRFSRTLIAVTAAAAPVVALVPSAQAAPSTPMMPRAPLPATPQGLQPSTPMPATPRVLPTPAVQSTVTMVVEASGGVNVRSGASTSYPVVGGHRAGTELTGTLTSNNWLKMPGGKFVAAWNLAPQSPGGGGGGGGSSQTVTRYMDAAVGNIRSGPGLNHSIVTTMVKGTKVTGTWTSNNWLDLGNGKFVSGGILTSTPPSGGGGGGVQETTRYISANVGNIRSGPGLNHSIVTTMVKGTKVTGTWTSNNWLDLGNGKFVSGGILTSTPPSGGGGGGGGPQETVRYISANVGNIRSGPGLNHSIVTTMVKGTQVSGTWTSNNWLDLGNGKFVSGGILTSTPPSGGVAPVPAPTPVRQGIIDTAADYVGSPYVLYGTPPDAFDCSSYTWWAYKQNGIDIPRTVRDQRTFVTPVTNPKPGDLVFYKNWYHVGIYAGPGMSYEAQNPQAGVVYGPIWDSQVWYGRVPGMP
ncbi:SH3 domain-containing protein [Ornithinimicrobium sp. LYQ92]|uniref:C40 family peptidase n=1 Tax=Serinicoccus sp. LYQ92 TaxID=3378798 RepID=UPI003852A957